MTEPVQCSLFDDVESPPCINTRAFAAARDYWLDDQSWVTHVPNLVSGDQRLVRDLAAIAPWEQRQRWMFNRIVDEPRLTAEYRDLDDAPALLVDLAAVLSAQLAIPYDRIWMNWYRDHRDGTGWHADRPANKPGTAVVPVVSLGAPRRFLIRPAGGGASTVFTPAGGDLLIMRGRCQRDWQHSVPKQKLSSGARMSLNFSSVTQA